MTIAFNGLCDYFEVFKAGEHTDSSGAKRTWTQDDLNTIVEKYNPEFNEAPVVIGHPKQDMPAFGWVDSLKTDNGVLYAKCKQVVPEFSEAVENGLYKKRSIALNPDLTLRHIGFLGAVPPAVKGLANINFSDDDNASVYFMDSSTAYRMNSIGDLFQGVKDLFIEKFGIDATNKAIGQYSIDNLKQSSPDDTQVQTQAFSAKEIKTMSKDAETAAEIAAKLKKKDDDNAALKAENDKLKKEKQKTSHKQFCEQLIGEGKMTPAQEGLAMDFLAMASDVGTFEFAEGDEKNAETKMKEFLSSMPKQITFGEFADKTKANDAAYFADEDAALGSQIAESVN